MEEEGEREEEEEEEEGSEGDEEAEEEEDGEKYVRMPKPLKPEPIFKMPSCSHC